MTDNKAEKLAREIIGHIARSSVTLAICRNSLEDPDTESEPDQTKEDEIIADAIDCLTGDETGCAEPEDLTVETCERLWLLAKLVELVEEVRAEYSVRLSEIVEFYEKSEGDNFEASGAAYAARYIASELSKLSSPKE